LKNGEKDAILGREMKGDGAWPIHLIMALGNEERKLLSSFWEKNQKLILASLICNKF
jgi:hypothetical protein